jgi:hypothetical protein
MRRVTRLAFAALSVLAVASCATTMSVSSHIDRSVNFARYHTYDWGPADELPSGDPRLDKNPFFQDHLQGEVERQMAAKGFSGPTSHKPDLLIHYHANIRPRINPNDRGNYGYCHDNDCREQIEEYEAGTIVLDVVDARTKKVIWRGWAQNSMEGVIDHPDRMAKTIHEAVTRMMAELPRSA